MYSGENIICRCERACGKNVDVSWFNLHLSFITNKGTKSHWKFKSNSTPLLYT